ncbi:MAG: hypothetical protein ACR5LD_03115 [Symbiopectobacterium sp.]
MLQLEQTLSVSDVAYNQFEQAQLVCKIVGNVSRSETWQAGRDVLRDTISQRYQGRTRASFARSSGRTGTAPARDQQEAERLLQEFGKRYGQPCKPEELDSLQQELELKIKTLSALVVEAGERRLTLRQELEHTQQHPDINRARTGMAVCAGSLDAIK